ncbi:hypothetical protein CDAR_397121 [Caerostris darwini]|uniref:Uncharacterized protein n=1 Tax=Caerostris darwini TaxID=1538125 RepID=A0AAV4MNM8_9ARAC|nr:hypothetical protein CDAR_397121 [Caerostris darwini]
MPCHTGMVRYYYVYLKFHSTQHPETPHPIEYALFLAMEEKQSILMLDDSQSEESSLLYKEPFVKNWNSRKRGSNERVAKSRNRHQQCSVLHTSTLTGLKGFL